MRQVTHFMQSSEQALVIQSSYHSKLHTLMHSSHGILVHFDTNNPPREISKTPVMSIAFSANQDDGKGDETGVVDRRYHVLLILQT